MQRVERQQASYSGVHTQPHEHSWCGIFGAFDIAYVHTSKECLTWRCDTRREALIHVRRGYLYAVQFIAVPSFRFNGAWYFALLTLFIFDASFTRISRRLSGPEYLMNIVLSALVGALLCSVFSQTWEAWTLPTEIASTDGVAE